MAEYLQVQLDATLMRQLGRQLAREAHQPGGGTLSRAFDAAGAVYMGFTRQRFVQFSRGGGSWPPLAPSTLRQRRKAKKIRIAKTTGVEDRRFKKRFEGSAAILWDTGTLLASIGNQPPERIPGGVRVGTAVHYAVYHQRGGPHLPKREIFVPPDPPTLQRIRQVLEAGYQRAVDQGGAAS